MLHTFAVAAKFLDLICTAVSQVDQPVENRAKADQKKTVSPAIPTEWPDHDRCDGSPVADDAGDEARATSAVAFKGHLTMVSFCLAST